MQSTNVTMALADDQNGSELIDTILYLLSPDDPARRTQHGGAGFELVEALKFAHRRGGDEAVRMALADLLQLQPPTPSVSAPVAQPRRRLIPASELASLPGVEWLIEGMIPKRGLTEIHGAPASGKSFLALHLAAQVAASHGHVIYFAGEGVSGYFGRVEAHKEAHSVTVDNLTFCIGSLDLRDGQDVCQFVEQVRPFSPAMIVIDTLARCTVGSEENGAKDMGEAVDGCEIIKRELGTAVLLVHHTGKSGTDPRGSNSLPGACDSMIYVARHNNEVTVTSQKLKDGKPFETYKLRMVEVGDSLALVPVARRAQHLSGLPDVTDNQRLVLEMLQLDIFLEVGGRHKRIAEHTGLSGGTLDRTLSELKELECIRQGKKGEPYFITETGLALVGSA